VVIADFTCASFIPTTFGTATIAVLATVVVVTDVGAVVVVVDAAGPVLRSRITVECTSAVEIDFPAALTTRAMLPTGTVALEIIWFAGHLTVR
jgi:hypothetical protein